jgi:signal transduction histidine kinase
VTAFIGGTSTLEQHGEALSPDERADILGGMRDRAQRMNEVITHLLDLDRLGAETAQAAQQHVDICALLAEIGHERGLDPSSLVLDCGQALVWADPEAVKDIMGHLLDNVGRHAPRSSVRISVAPVDGGVEIVVDDDGPGIPAGMHEAIFEPFRQGDTDQSALGMGVGLAYALRHAELQGGRIRAMDREERGARFVVFLPA